MPLWSLMFLVQVALGLPDVPAVVGFVDPPLEGESGLQVALPPGVSVPSVAWTSLTVPRAPWRCRPVLPKFRASPPAPTAWGIWGLHQVQVLVETNHVLAASDGVSCLQCGGLVPCWSVAATVAGRDGALLPSAEAAEPGHWGASSPRLPVPPGLAIPASQARGPLRQCCPGAQACPCPRLQAGSSRLQASPSPGCTLRPLCRQCRGGC